MDKLEDRYLIKKFLRKELSKSEIEVFISRKEDPKFIEKLEHEIIIVQNRKILKQKLQKISSAPVTKTEKKSNIKWYAVGIAASIFLYLGLQFFTPNILDNQVLYKKAYSVYPNIYSQKGFSDTSSSFLEIMKLYDASDYYNSKNEFEKLKKQKGTLNNKEAFYYGICLLELDNPLQAQAEFITIENKNSPLYTDARWYLALSYLKTKNIEKTNTILKSMLELKNLGKNKKEEVIQLLKSLKKF